MSEYERNKGILIPVSESDESIAERVVKEIPGWAESKVDAFLENASEYGYERLNGKLYQMERLDVIDHDPEYCKIHINSVGDIEFESYHYNGGGRWTEMVEQAIANFKAAPKT